MPWHGATEISNPEFHRKPLRRSTATGAVNPLTVGLVPLKRLNNPVFGLKALPHKAQAFNLRGLKGRSQTLNSLLSYDGPVAPLQIPVSLLAPQTEQ